MALLQLYLHYWQLLWRQFCTWKHGNFRLDSEWEYARRIQLGTSEHQSELLQKKNLDSSVCNALAIPYHNARQKAQSVSIAVNRFYLLTGKPEETGNTVPPIQYNMDMSEKDQAELTQDEMYVVPSHAHISPYQGKSYMRPEKWPLNAKAFMRKARVVPEWTDGDDEEITQIQTPTNERRERFVSTRQLLQSQKRCANSDALMTQETSNGATWDEQQ